MNNFRYIALCALISLPTGLSAQRLFEARTDYGTGQVQPESVAAGDFNSDGNVDLLVGHGYDGGVSIFMGRGEGWFDPPTFLNTGFFPDDFLVSDFNNDGTLDFAVNKSFVREVGIWFGNGDGTFILGERVSIVHEGYLSAGEHQISWDASEIASGIYTG